MPYRCPQCGATFSADETCEDRFYAGQALEMTDASFGAVHHLSVPCFMLQHNRYSRVGWIGARQVLARFLDGMTPGEARRQYQQSVASGNRTYSFTRGEKLAGVDAIPWTRTVADVCLDTAAHYCADVRAWAESIVRDSQALMCTASASDRPQVL
jgi:hypothetical protein